MESHIEDVEQEVLRLFMQPLDDLRHRIACITDGHIQPVVIDYVANSMLMRYCEGPPGDEEHQCYAALTRLGASSQSHFRSTRHEDTDRRAVYYAVALPGSLHYKHPWVIFQAYAKPESKPWYAGVGWPRQNSNMLVGYKGDQFLETGMVRTGPYLPLYVTP